MMNTTIIQNTYRGNANSLSRRIVYRDVKLNDVVMFRIIVNANFRFFHRL